MSRFLWVFVVVAAIGLSACGRAPTIKKYEGPEVTRILVYKEARKMYLLHNRTVLRTFDFELGFAPTGDKHVEGDGRTPEGDYIIDRRNPNSDFHLSLGISYPNARDIAVARRAGLDPGGDIFIHGTPRLFKRHDDWTWGCIAVTNDEIEDMYSMVPNGVPISIYP
jgi:murein L,D-transpeptidase YafK